MVLSGAVRVCRCCCVVRPIGNWSLLCSVAIAAIGPVAAGIVVTHRGEWGRNVMRQRLDAWVGVEDEARPDAELSVIKCRKITSGQSCLLAEKKLVEG
jgi:hypothetical protein